MQTRIFGIYVFALIFAPLAFGAVERWSLTIMEISSLSAFLLFYLPGTRLGKPVYAVPGKGPLLCFNAYLILTLIPLPAGLVHFVSPATWTLYTDTADAQAMPIWMPLTIHPQATLLEFFRLTAYSAFYLLTIQLLASKDRLIKTVRIIVIFAALLATASIIEHFASFKSTADPNRTVFWIRKLAHGGSPFGPFVNRNHYAAWMGMIFPIVLGLFLFYQPIPGRQSWRERIIGFLLQNRTNTHILLGVAAVLIAGSVFFSLSRGGIISLCLASIIFIFMVILLRPKRGGSKRALGIFIIIFLLVGTLGWDPILRRFAEIHDIHGAMAGQRWTIWQDSLAIARHFPAVGTGFGTFTDIYPRYGHFTDNLIVKHAENDYLEWLVEGGVAGMLLISWFLITCVYKTLQALRKRKDTYAIYLCLGTLAGIISILLHGLVDFNLHIGANGLYFFFLLGLFVSAAHTRRHCPDTSTLLSGSDISRDTVVRYLLPVGCGAVILAALCGLIGQWTHASIKDVRLAPKIPHPALAEMTHRSRRACRLDPLNDRFEFTAGNIDAFGRRKVSALKHYRSAVQLNPAKGAYLQRLATFLAARQQYAAADRLFRAAIKYDPATSERYLADATWRFSRGQKEDALASLQQAMNLDPGHTEESLTLMVLNKIPEKEMATALPRRVVPYLRFARYLVQIGNVDLADAIFRQALHLIPGEKPVKWTYFEAVYRFYMHRGRLDTAGKVLRNALKRLPKNVPLRLRLADLYRSLGQMDQAVIEYRRALHVAPANREIKRLLKKALGPS